MPIDDFITEMETERNGKPLHEILRNERIEKNKQSTKDLKSTVSIKIDTRNDDLSKAITNFDEKQKQQLASAIAAPMASISFSDSSGQFSTKNISPLTKELASNAIENNDINTIKTLLELGVTNRADFLDTRPLYEAASKGNEQIVRLMLSDSNIQKSLEQELNSPEDSSLLIAVIKNNIKKIFTMFLL
ncbi:MAG: hypothetical protein RCG15_07160 [Candidatus Rickettsia vulgarisii]